MYIHSICNYIYIWILIKWRLLLVPPRILRWFTWINSSIFGPRKQEMTNPPPSLEVLILMSWRWNSWSTNETQLAEYGSPLWTTSISSQHRGSITVTSWWSRMRGTQHLLHPLKLAWDAWDSKKVRGQGLAHGKCEALSRPSIKTNKKSRRRWM